MNIKDIQGSLPQITKEQILNIAYQTRDHKGVLALLAKSEEGLLLWEVCQRPEDDPPKTRRRRKIRTNREVQKEAFNQGSSPFLQGVKFGEHTFSLASASGGYIGESYNKQDKFRLIYLLTKGVKVGILEEEPLTNLMLNCYQFADKDMPELLPKDLEQVELTFEARHIPVPVNRRCKLSSGTYKKPRVIKITGEEEVTVYISGVTFYDIWKQAETEFEDKKYQDRFTKEEIAKMKKQYLDMLPSICPKDCVLPVIEYESDKNYQMQFFTTDFLRRDEERSGSSFMLLGLRSDKQTGPMGFESRVCKLEPVKKGYEGSFEVELFYYYKVLPRQVVWGQRV